MTFKFISSTTLPVEEDPDVAETTLVSVYESVGQLTCSITYEEIDEVSGLITPRQIELISYISPYQGVIASQFDLQTVQLNGIASNVFNGSVYKFLMPDNSIKILPANTTEKFDALIEWSPPSVRVTTVIHSFQIKVKRETAILDTIETFTVQQDVYWRYQIGLQAFRDLLARGTA